MLSDKKKSIFNNLDFSQNYQKTFNNYANAAKYFTNSSQIIDSIEKIINSYKDSVIAFKKKCKLYQLQKLRNWLTYDNIRIFSLNQQKNLLPQADENKTDEFWDKSMEHLGNASDVENVIAFFGDYTLVEIVWELVLKEDFNSPKALEEIQYLASCFVEDGNAFQISVDGLWWPQTWAFFDMLLSNDDFVNSPRGKEYVDKVHKIMEWRKDFGSRRHDLNLYRGFSDVSRSMEEYSRDPLKYWESQSVLSRSFVWLEWKPSYPSVDSMAKSESMYIDTFISANKNSGLNAELSNLFDREWKSPRQVEEIEKRLKALMPKDLMEKHLTKFLQEEKVREEFSKMFNLPSSVLDDPYIVKTIVDDKWWNVEFTKVRGWILSWMWASMNSELDLLSADLKNHIRKQCWISALWVKTKFLEWIFWEWADIETIEKESGADVMSDEYTIYFKDNNCPSTTYEYRPNTGEIYAEKAYNYHNSILSFGKTNAPELIYTMDAKFSDFIQNISIEGVLPKDRCDTSDDLKDEISKKIDESMKYSVWGTTSDILREKNDIKRFKNWIMDNTLKLFWYKKMDDSDISISLSEEGDWAYYHMMTRIVNSIDWANYDELSELNEFLTWLLDKINAVNELDLESESDPLLKFVLSEYKSLSSNSDAMVKSDNQADEWKKKDLVLWVLMNSLCNVDWKIDFKKVIDLNKKPDTNRYNELVRLIKSDYYKKAEKFDVAVVEADTGKELHRLEDAVWRENEFSAKIEDAFA